MQAGVRLPQYRVACWLRWETVRAVRGAREEDIVKERGEGGFWGYKQVLRGIVGDFRKVEEGKRVDKVDRVDVDIRVLKY